MNIELRPLAEIKPYEKNPRINDQAVDAVAESIQRFGFRQPIVVDTDGVIVCGHTRWKAAQKLGFEKVPVHVAKDLTPEQVRAYRIADNKTNELAEWNLDLLPIELAELQDAGIDWSLLGFDSDELAMLLDPGVKEGLTDPDDVPEPPDEATTQPGDLWVLPAGQAGLVDHRLLCGDSASAVDVDLLIAVDPAKAIARPATLERPAGSDAKPKRLPIQLVNTDPPYNVKVEARLRRPHSGLKRLRRRFKMSTRYRIELQDYFLFRRLLCRASVEPDKRVSTHPALRVASLRLVRSHS